MKLFVWNIMLGLVWISLTGDFSGGGLFTGFVFGYFVLALIARMSGEMSGYVHKIPQVAAFVFFYMGEIIKSNVRVAYEVLSPTHKMQPGVIGLPLEAESDAAITILANLITMTPGTLSLDVSNDRKMLFIHAMYINDEDTLRKDLKNLERRVLDLLS
ncbi:MAG: Na+/H+ antiporter subunit E [Gammaproteobacteria bacterium]